MGVNDQRILKIITKIMKENLNSNIDVFDPKKYNMFENENKYIR